ncbi:MAG: ATP-binding protein [Bacteroidales bacterium]|jgi:NadR type nicotinamide-nucleotide adenylyltransferase|nr:ATP-binding protein [Bacteroidales bacterium]HOI33426.1 ATP-binding protein [Bacteroidales bacterium]
MSVRIAITGPESTGKSWLAEALAKHYHTQWVPEFARDYLKNKTKYHAADVINIANGQLQLEQRFMADYPAVLFSDTEMLVCKIWLEFVFGLQDDFIEKALKNQGYDLYLLCDIDLEWEPDPLREHPTERKILFELYKSHLEKMHFPYRIVSGKGRQRLEKAVTFVDQLIKS